MIKIIKKSVLLIILITFLIQLVIAQNIDSDNDGIIDEFDNCPQTKPNDELPIILRNPEFLGCSCSQIFNELKEEYCKDIYCYPGRVLEIKDRFISLRPNPCPSSRCEETTLYEYTVDEILCRQGKELPYTCEEIITENAEKCILLLEQESREEQEQQESTINKQKDIFDFIIESYYTESKYLNILNIKNKEELMLNNEKILKNLNIERIVNVDERIINNKIILVKDISIVIKPKNNYLINDFIIIEQIKGDLTNKNLVIQGESFYDEKLQMIVWEIDSLKKETILNYRITPSADVEFDMLVHGNSKNLILTKVLIPIGIIIIIISILIFWIINKKEKNNIFKT